MKTLKRTGLASAVAAATAGVSMLVLTAPADARDIDDELQDELLIFPYYTVRDGWITLANITNTSPYTAVLKVRYRESYNSRDVLDFNLILSPFDVWTGWVTEGPNGPRLYTRDASCTTPIFNDAGDGSRYADFSVAGHQSDGGPTGIDRTREGHFEVITMAQFFPGSEDKIWDDGGNVSPGDSKCADFEPEQSENDCAYNSTDNTISWSKGDPMYPTAYYAKHEDGKPRDCSIVDSRFLATASTWTVEDIVDDGFHGSKDYSNDGNPMAEWDNKLNRAYWPWWQADDPDHNCYPDIDNNYAGCRRTDTDDYLKGNYGLVNVSNGIASGGIPVAHSSSCNYATEDMITAQQYPWFLEPTLYSYGCDLWDWDRDLSTDLSVDALNNEWSFNVNTGAETDWVVTFPTKEFHTDVSESDIYAGANPVRLRDECDNDTGDSDKPWICDSMPWSGDITAEKQATFEEAFIQAGGLYYGVWYDESRNKLVKQGFEEPFDGQSCDTVVYNLWDREEDGVEGSGTSISPAPPQPVDSLCYESNVLSFQSESALGSDLALEVDTGVLNSGAAAGWLKLQLSQDCSFADWGKDDANDFCFSEGELPAIGFMFKSRDFGDPGRNFGVLSEHGYDD